MTALIVEHSTPLCSLQDGGRFGVRHLGITQGGAADWVSMGWANWLLGNPLAAAVVEVTLGQFSLRAERDCHLALAGADLEATVDGQHLLPWRSVHLRAGQTLQFKGPRAGARAYLAAPGGWLAPRVLGSCATVARDRLGGLGGRGAALAAGDRLVYRGPAREPRQVAVAQPPNISLAEPLQVVLGAQMAYFSGQSLFDAFDQTWVVDPRADRMGVRLCGPRLHYQGPPMISEGIPLGGIQVPPDGQPIVLGNDRQTIGGYPRLGALAPASLARLAQALPGDMLRLQPVVAEQARASHLRVLRQWA
ncbi:biotin-dependent carboxyltransferase family protein [Pseudomonas typographi]|uniref:Biotin-dependent carboxyltransferase family protein n=1 Tax=Pseudomonas typographi TaxID=2715964 RepID=A0ABR7Z0M4_9PSED|nr:biotin-dependent carboxyltransferase family protein [Pseudomonas typographi]MBD1589306.1 biotin-dependent carboxyltransferase family protein [Pseudomonas typographi]MBD1598983.1 biotin-dependent carboxyltransferase family protein [Pseudomonas typographi]